MHKETVAPHLASTYRHMLRGVSWALAMRWAIRGISLVSMLILARLLTPADFGIVAMGSLVIGFLQVFSEMGVAAVLIREADISRKDCDSAWTIQLIQGAFVAVVLLLAAQPAATYFHEPRLVAVINLLAVSALIGGAENVGMVLVRKELDFAKDFRYALYKRLLVFFVTVLLAVLIRNYWALAIGQLVGTCLEVVLSYVMHPYRPRFSMQKARSFLVFSRSLVPFNIAKFLNDRLDTFVVGGLANTGAVGAYSLASELSTMVTREIVVPMGRGLYPMYAKIVGDSTHLADAFRYALGAATILCLPLGCGLAAVSQDAVAVVLGDQWQGTVLVLKWLSIYAVLTSLMHLMSGDILMVAGRERLSSCLRWFQFAVLVTVTLPAARWGPEGVAVSVTAAAAISFPVVVYALSRALALRFRELLTVFWRPALAACLMVAAVIGLHNESIGIPAMRLAIDVGIGFVSYVVALLVTWLVAGKPRGAESAVVQFLLTRVKSVTARST